jgi:succinyl-diaminopimelate desuccinylase
LVQAESTAEKGELAAAQVIAAELNRFGMNAQIDRWDQNRANIVARVESAGRKGALMFVSHLDVVGPGEAAWEHPPFAAAESDSKIHGRGATDMKGGIAAAVAAMCRIVESGVKLQGDVIFVGTAGEETDSCGAERFLDKRGDMPAPAGIIVTEPTDFDVVTAHRGLLWLKVVTKGKAAHGSTPHLGVNAITSMRRFLDALEENEVPFEPHELLGECSVSVNTISGGKARNIVPDSCSAALDIRTVPTQRHEDIVRHIEGIFRQLRQVDDQFAAEVSTVRDVEPLVTNPDSNFVKDFCSVVGTDQTKAVGFTTDGPYFASLGGPVVIYGPGRPERCHRPNEYIDLADVEKAAELYRNLLLQFLT